MQLELVGDFQLMFVPFEIGRRQDQPVQILKDFFKINIFNSFISSSKGQVRLEFEVNV